MPQIIDITYFQKANELNIPLSVENIVANPALKTPNSTDFLTLLCERVEKSILVNALGLLAYNELQEALEDLEEADIKWKRLVEGYEYDGKIWVGLDNDYSLIAYKIFEEFLTETNQRLTGVGPVEGNPEKAILVSPRYKIANASQNFIKGYQKGYLIEPIVIGEFIDWYGCNDDINVSLYQYLLDQKEDFTNVDLAKFRTYETQNSFGI
jgi:hypothetical protein